MTSGLEKEWAYSQTKKYRKAKTSKKKINYLVNKRTNYTVGNKRHDSNQLKSSTGFILSSCTTTQLTD